TAAPARSASSASSCTPRASPSPTPSRARRSTSARRCRRTSSARSNGRVRTERGGPSWPPPLPCCADCTTGGRGIEGRSARRFIFGERGGIYIIDLLKTQALLEQAQQFCSEVAHRGGTVLFVGTKKQARDSIKEVAENAGMPYVHHRWLGGLLTNFQTISLRIK